MALHSDIFVLYHRRNQIINVASRLHIDDLTFGLGGIASDEYWNFAHTTADYIISQRAFPWLEGDFLNRNDIAPYQIPDLDIK